MLVALVPELTLQPCRPQPRDPYLNPVPAASLTAVIWKHWQLTARDLGRCFKAVLVSLKRILHNCSILCKAKLQIGSKL